MFRLRDLLEYQEIAIQCHNFPDADTIASAFAIYTYLKENGKTPRLFYSGPGKITKPNLVRMVELLSIPVEHLNSLPRVEALVLADCQYGESNVAKFEADMVFMLDHHEDKGFEHVGIIQSALGSCSTLIWDLLKKENFDFDKYPDMSAALYYGLYTDTSSLEEISHPLDKDMRDSVKFDHDIINSLRFNNLTMDELSIAGAAFSHNSVNQKYGYATFKAAACDQNILGFISDLALQVENVGVCIVYNTLPNGYKLSIRSCSREVMANEFASFLADGGGHKQKAGGFISKDKIGSMNIDEYIESRANEYFESYDIISCGNHNLDISSMSRYVKSKIPAGYVKTADIFAKDTPLSVRTLEGDSEITASPDIFLMIGYEGEVYPIKAEKFQKSYQATDQPYSKTGTAYSPTVRNKITGQTIKLEAYAKTCLPKGEVQILAKPLERNVKVFTSWNLEGYYCGKPGDYIAVRADDQKDVYIIREDIFYKTYESVNP
ncbi:MAG: DHH family phosphoesterase [Oscillospiraceae bacterium]|nr:DHH family phosphoesterase [Oscillospiraceae bacterium]